MSAAAKWFAFGWGPAAPPITVVGVRRPRPQPIRKRRKPAWAVDPIFLEAPALAEPSDVQLVNLLTLGMFDV